MAPEPFYNLEELEGLARKVLPDMVFNYYRGGADSEATVRDNRAVYSRYKLLPSVMRDVSQVDASTSFLGEKVAFPVAIAPMSMNKMAHPEGEAAIARAVAKAGIPMIVSTMGTTRMDEVAKAASGAPAMMFQLYVFKERKSTLRLIKEAADAGYKAIVVTVDVPTLGNREDDHRYNFKLPSHLHLENFTRKDMEEVDAEVSRKGLGSKLKQTMSHHHDGSLTWEFVPWLRQHTHLPIYVKGILSPRDAERALENGVDGIIVSNHGGRQLDFAPAALDMLPAIKAVVGDRIPVLIDGGIRRGTDVIKAIALGANGVLIGRPILYSLAVNGQAGVEAALQMLRREIELSMALCGCARLADINRALVLPPALPQSRI